MTKVVALHGFLGDSSQWQDCIALDLYQYNNLTELEEEIQRINPTVIIGYSMGGRLALHLASLMLDKLERVIVLGGNLGLQSKDEVEKRIDWEARWCSKLETLSREDFYKEWNDQAIFKNDTPIEDFNRETTDILRLLKLYPLSKQPNFRPMVKDNPKFILAAGEHDRKYLESYRQVKNDVEVILDCGHRILNNETAKKLLNLIS